MGLNLIGEVNDVAHSYKLDKLFVLSTFSCIYLDSL